MAEILITTQPVSSSAIIGTNVTLTVEATVTPEAVITYQWFKNGIAVEGATNSTLVVESTNVVSSATYNVIVSSAGAESVTSNEVTVSFTLPEYITGAFANSYIAICGEEIQTRFSQLQVLRGIQIPNNNSVLLSKQLSLFMDAI